MITFIKIILTILLAVAICTCGPAAIANMLVATLSPSSGTKKLALRYSSYNLALIAAPIVVFVILHFYGL